MRKESTLNILLVFLHLVSDVLGIAWVEKPSDTTSVIGGDAVFNCDYTGSYLATWAGPQGSLFVNNISMATDNRFSIRGLFSLHISNVKKQDQGEYTCTVQGLPPEKGYLNVYIPPHNISVITNDTRPSQVEGDFVSLTCSSIGNPPPEITWFREGSQLTDSATIQIIQKPSIGHGNIETLVTSQLIIKLQYTDHNKNFYCSAKNDMNLNNPSKVPFLVQVQYKPRITLEPSPLNILLGSSSQLRCIVSANPQVTRVRWQKDTQVLQDTEAVLRFPSVDRTAAGQYTCSASNTINGQVQTDSKSTSVTVIYPPIITVPATAVVNVSGVLHLYCAVDANPPPLSVKWRKLDSSRESTSANFTASPVTRDYEGNYTCIVMYRLEPSGQSVEQSQKFAYTYVHVQWIQVEFDGGNLIFDWEQTISSIGPFDVIITRDSQSSEMFTVNNTSLVVQDLLNFSSVSISVKKQTAITYYNRTFEVALFSSSSGYDKVIHWEMPYFPKSGHIKIFHEQRPNEYIFEIKDPNVFYTKPHKYKYMSIPVNSVFVNFTIFNTTQNDAGFYYDKITMSEDADVGAFLIVYDKPTRPTIYGQTDVKIGDLVNLTCYSRSTSTPTYYKQFPQLRFTWFLNGTEVPSVRGGVLVFTARKKHRFIPITCQSTEIESSEMSNKFLIDVTGNDKYVTTPLTPTIGTTRNQISTSEAFLTNKNYLQNDSGDEMKIMMIVTGLLSSVIIILITLIIVIKLKGGKMSKKNIQRKTLSSQYLTPSADNGNSTLSVIYNRDGADHYNQINEDSTSYIYIDL